MQDKAIWERVKLSKQYDEWCKRLLDEIDTRLGEPSHRGKRETRHGDLEIRIVPDDDPSRANITVAFNPNVPTSEPGRVISVRWQSEELTDVADKVVVARTALMRDPLYQRYLNSGR